MRILIIHCSYKQKGGEDTVVDEEIKLLRSHGATVELLQFYNDGHSMLKLLQLPFNIHSYLQTRRKLHAFKPDVVHIHNLHFGGSVSIIYAIRKSGIPSVLTLHNFRLLCPSATLFQNGRLYLYSLQQTFPWKAIMQGAYRNSVPLTFWVALSMQMHQWMGTWKMFTRYIVLSQHSKTMFLGSKLKLNNRQVAIKPNFCSAPEVVGSHADNYFLYVGRLSEEKGIMMMLRAFAATGFRIKIAGDGPMKEQVVKYSTKHRNIEYLNFQDKEAIINLMNNCTALVFPSIWYEGMPLTIIEAFSSSTPVIASRLGAMENMISDRYNGLHFEPGDEQDLKLKLSEWHNMQDEQKAVYRENARKTYDQHYTLDKNYEQLISIYTAAIEEKSKVTKNVYRPARRNRHVIS